MKKIEKNQKIENQDDDRIEILEKLKKVDIEQKKLYCLYIIIILLIIQIALPYMVDNKKIESNQQIEVENEDYDISDFDEISISKLDEVAKNKTPQIVFIGRSNCSYCVKFLPILKKAQQEYKYKTYYINLNNITDDDKKILFKYDNNNKFIETNFGSTPMVLSFENGKMKEGWVGYAPYNQFQEFLTRSGLSK